MTRDITLQSQALELAHVMIRSVDGTIRLWTHGMERLYGYTREEAVGQTADRLLRTVFPRPRGEIEAELRGSGQWSGELVHRRRDGTTIIVASHWSLSRDDAGHPVAVTEVNNDITEQKRSESARLHLAAIVESSTDAIIGKTVDGIVTSWNEAAAAMFGYAAEEMIGRPITTLFPPGRLVEEGMILDRVRRGERVEHYETVRRRKDGTEIEVSLTVSPIRDAAGTVVGVSKIARDITERKLAEACLQNLQSELLHVSRLSTMDRMASTLAHELNQPLTAVTNYLSALRRLIAAGPGADPKRVDEILDRTVEQATRAGQVIRRLREFVAKGETERRIEGVNDMVEDAAGLALVGARQEGVAASMEFGGGIPKVLVDRVQIQQVLINLVRNALEAMERSATRELRIATRYLHDSRQAEITVADTGPGIAPEIANRLFQPFVSTKKTGMGLGLSICREIVEAHGGMLSAAGVNEPTGTVFSMIVPIAAVAEEQAAGDA
ncbi:MAG TPA: PAS domain S-box protein [Stellaceae bacterium]